MPSEGKARTPSTDLQRKTTKVAPAAKNVPHAITKQKAKQNVSPKGAALGRPARQAHGQGEKPSAVFWLWPRFLFDVHSIFIFILVFLFRKHG